MKRLIEHLKENGSVVEIKGNSPQLLTNSEYVWLVEKGKVNIFSVRIADGEIEGSRSFILALNEERLAFGLPPLGEGKKTGFIASGAEGTRLIRINRSFIIKLFSDEAYRQELAMLIDDWTAQVFKAVGINDVINAGQYLEDLVRWNTCIMEKVIESNEDSRAAVKQRLEARIAAEKRYMQSSIVQLAGITGSKGANGENGSALETDALLAACIAVGEKMHITINRPKASQNTDGSKFSLNDIARASRFHMRQVVLKGKWWKQDNGSMLAYMEEDGRPVALLQKNASLYELYDPKAKITVLVDDITAGKLKPFAFYFYRPFPAKKLNLKDILLFGIESTWKTDTAILLIAGLAGGLLGMVTPIVSGIIFNTVIPDSAKSELIQIGFILSSVAVATLLFQLTRSFAMQRIEAKLDNSIQSAVWDRLLSLPTPFFKEYTSGDLAMRAMGINEIRRMLSGAATNTVLSAIFSLFNLALLFKYNVKLALFACLFVIVSILVTLVFGRIEMNHERESMKISNKISGLVLEILSGIAKFKIAGAESRAFYQWAQSFKVQREIAYKKRLAQNGLSTFNAVFTTITSGFIFYLIIRTKNAGLAAGDFIAFNGAFAKFFSSMVSLSQTFMSVNTIVPMFELSKPILETLPEFNDEKKDPGVLAGNIEINHVTFRYKEDSPIVLEDVSVKINEGEYVALVGPSGCGKSTLFRTLLGFEKPQSGKIYYDGQDLDSIDVRAVRKQLGVVLQNGQLMSGDIFTNIVASNPNLTMKDAVEAAKMAGFYADIEQMPMGMHTMISEGAGTLSGGQRQRLLIARAIVNKPRIIYFDEATSALDNTTQAIVSKSLDNLNATRIVIAHRLSTIVNCDRIIVMDKGRVVEDGTYDELIKRNGVFSQLAARQLA